CKGIPCPQCGKRLIRRPISNNYDEPTGTVWHTPWLGYLMRCATCRASTDLVTPSVAAGGHTFRRPLLRRLRGAARNDTTWAWFLSLKGANECGESSNARLVSARSPAYPSEIGTFADDPKEDCV